MTDRDDLIRRAEACERLAEAMATGDLNEALVDDLATFDAIQIHAALCYAPPVAVAVATRCYAAELRRQAGEAGGGTGTAPATDECKEAQEG